jgi:hypothetical protein
MLAAGLFALFLICLIMSLLSANGLTRLVGTKGFDPDKEARGLRLLNEWLSPQQLECYQQNGFFEVIGGHTGTLYRVHHGRQTNIEEIDNSGQPVAKWCFVPLGNLVAGDVMLAQKIALEINERSALAIANRSPTSYTV